MRINQYLLIVITLALVFMINPAFAGIDLKEGVAHYTGSISKQLNEQFFNLVKGKTVNRLVITSDGGDVAAGIALGSWVHQFGVDVEIREYCLSSCANYVFTAGKNKVITSGAVVAWHGNYNHLKQTGSWRDELPAKQSKGEDEASATRRLLDQVDELVRMEQDFFKRIGVDEYVCWVGKMPPYDVPNYYFLSAKDMAKFGIQWVETPKGYAQTDVSHFTFHIVFLSL